MVFPQKKNTMTSKIHDDDLQQFGTMIFNNARLWFSKVLPRELLQELLECFLQELLEELLESPRRSAGAPAIVHAGAFRSI
jgi:lauroyl/myristoyl acyltransferase